MSSWPEITAAMETRLSTLTPRLSTGWENVRFTPPTDSSEPYQVVNFLPTEPENPTFGDGMYRERGIMQITLFYPQQGGAGAVRQRAEAIRSWFPRATSLASGSVTVIIERTPAIGIARAENGRYVLPVSIRYFANITH